jgi:hypothetical protein
MGKIYKVPRRLKPTIRVAGLCSLLLIAICLGVLWGLHRPTELTIALLERHALSDDPVFMQQAEVFESMHRKTIESLIKEFNRKPMNRGTRFRLRLLPPDRRPTKAEASDYSTYLASRYAALAVRKDLVAVLDNNWGKDIYPLAKKLRSFPAPIAFLNADHNGADYGSARLFLGSSDQVPQEIHVLLIRLFEQRDQTSSNRNFVFLTEENYRLTERFKAVFKEHTLTPTWVKVSSDTPSNRQEIASAKANIIAAFLGQDKWKTMQSNKKILVLNLHATWGQQLLPWLDDNFQNLTVIGYESALGRIPNFKFGQNGNELILLSDSINTIPEQLLLRYNDLKRANPEEFQSVKSVLFVRRCLIAMEACGDVLEKRNWVGLEPSRRFQFQVCNGWELFRNSKFNSTLGIYQFSKSGELLRQNHVLLYNSQGLSSFYYQIDYKIATSREASGGDVEEPQPNAVLNTHCGIGKLSIRDIDIMSGSLHADLDYRLRKRKVASDKDAQTLEPIDFDPGFITGVSGESPGQRRLARKSSAHFQQETFRASGTFNAALNSWSYPFDRHQVKLEFRAWKSDDEMRLSCEESMGEAPYVSGWEVMNSYVSLNNRESDPVPLSLGTQSEEGSQYDILSVTVDLRRRLWSAVILIVVPLALLVAGSLAVLFINFGKRANDLAVAVIGTPETRVSAAVSGENHRTEVLSTETDEDIEALKTQTELSLGTVIAIITYLISYATLVPRLQTPLYSDVLVGFSLAIAMFNFVFLVAVRHSRFFNFWTLNRYRQWAVAISTLGFVSWLVGGAIIQGFNLS